MTTYNFTKGLIGKEDLKMMDTELYPSEQFSRIGQLGTSTLYKLSNSAMTHNASINARYWNSGNQNLTTIRQALSYIGSNQRTLYLEPGTWSITDNLTIPANITILADIGTAITISSGKQLTINGYVISGAYRIFYGDGTVSVSTYPTDRAWWGESERLDVYDLSIQGNSIGSIKSLKNKVINGDCRIAQKGTSFAPATHNTVNLDMYRYFGVGAAACTVTQDTDVPSGYGFKYSLKHEVTTADTSIASNDLVTCGNRIEGYNIADLYNTTFTVSFWVKSNKTGTFGFALRNQPVTHSYVKEITINSANTWEYKTITITNGLTTSATWLYTTGIGLHLQFVLMCGTQLQTATTGSWVSGNYITTANQTNFVDTVGNTFAITGLQLELGSQASSFEFLDYGTELIMCQRYYYRVSGNKTYGYAWAVTTSSALIVTPFPVQMRTAPTALEQSGIATDYQIYLIATVTACNSVPTFNSQTSTWNAITAYPTGATLTAGDSGIGQGANAAAYLGWDASL